MYGNSSVFNASVENNAHIYDNAELSGVDSSRADLPAVRVRDNARVYGNAKIKGEVCIYGNAEISGNLS